MRLLLGYLVDFYINFHVVVHEAITSLGYLVEDALDAWGEEDE